MDSHIFSLVYKYRLLNAIRALGNYHKEGPNWIQALCVGHMHSSISGILTKLKNLPL